MSQTYCPECKQQPVGKMQVCMMHYEKKIQKSKRYFILLETRNANDRRTITDLVRDKIGVEIRYINVDPEVEERLDEYGDPTGDSVVVI